MSHEALIADLQRKSDERIKEIWRKVEKEVEKAREEKHREFERRQAEVQGRLKEVEEEVAAPILHQAKCSALAIEDAALARLSERLYDMAAEMLVQLRQNDYEALFTDLAKEVSGENWDNIEVNPLDVGLARSLFPGAEVVADPSIVGGFRANADHGRYRVVNTLAKRLEKSWPAILPLLLHEVTGVQDAEPAG